MLKLDDTIAGGIRAKLDAVDWATVIPKVTLYAHKRLGGRGSKVKERAKEIAQDAIVQLYDPARVRWDGETEPDIVYVLCGLVNGLVMNDKRRASNTRETVVEERELSSYGGALTPEELLDGERQRAQGMASLRARVANHAATTALVDLVARGIDTPAEQVEASGLSLEDVRNARKRMFRAAEAIAREQQEQDASEGAGPGTRSSKGKVA